MFIYTQFNIADHLRHKFWSPKGGEADYDAANGNYPSLSTFTNVMQDMVGMFKADLMKQFGGDVETVRLGKMYHRWTTMARWASTNVEFARIFTLTTDGTFSRV